MKIFKAMLATFITFGAMHLFAQDNLPTVNPVTFTPESPFFTDSIVVTLNCSTPGATIIFNLSGRPVDTIRGIQYQSPMVFRHRNAGNGFIIQARAFKQGMTPSTTVTKKYVPVALGTNSFLNINPGYLMPINDNMKYSVLGCMLSPKTAGILYSYSGLEK